MNYLPASHQFVLTFLQDEPTSALRDTTWTTSAFLCLGLLFCLVPVFLHPICGSVNNVKIMIFFHNC